jgi:hypothetical protein
MRDACKPCRCLANRRRARSLKAPGKVWRAHRLLLTRMLGIRHVSKRGYGFAAIQLQSSMTSFVAERELTDGLRNRGGACPGPIGTMWGGMGRSTRISPSSITLAAGELPPRALEAKCVFKKTPDLDTRTTRKRRRRHTSGRRYLPLRDINYVDVGILEIYMIYQQVLGRSCSGPRRSNRGVPMCRCSKAT